jgi:hypothetical protein
MPIVVIWSVPLFEIDCRLFDARSWLEIRSALGALNKYMPRSLLSYACDESDQEGNVRSFLLEVAEVPAKHVNCW